MKNLLLVIALMFVGSSSYAGECSGGVCSSRRPVAHVAKRVVTAPVRVVKKTVRATKNFCHRNRRGCCCR